MEQLTSGTFKKTKKPQQGSLNLLMLPMPERGESELLITITLF